MKKLIFILILSSMASLLYAQSPAFRAVFVVDDSGSSMVIQNVSEYMVHAQVHLVNRETGEDFTVAEGFINPGEAYQWGTNVNWIWLPGETLNVYSSAGLHVWKVPYTSDPMTWTASIVEAPLIIHVPLDAPSNSFDPFNPGVGSGSSPGGGDAERWRGLKEDAQRRLATAERQLSDAIASENYAIEKGFGQITASMRVRSARDLVNTLRNQVADYSRKEQAARSGY